MIIEEYYDELVKDLPKGITTDLELQQLANDYFVPLEDEKNHLRFKGVFMRSLLPKVLDPGDALIFNSKDQPGEHWLAVVRSPKTKYYYVYDSFGRKNSAFNLPSKYHQSDPKPEQQLQECNCGARALVWILTADNFGVDETAQVL